ncbi:hypothetical protein OSB04_017589 [Centaurea solstitialis]|uniref:Uncharacterized protein n=1 Tax=Centaurea solstitialis TaxID=347529 RepID=A0AA38T363_9ASTR|nr:hypothetical protein OSB04_017589 [Centaurea solstitialis]
MMSFEAVKEIGSLVLSGTTTTIAICSSADPKFDQVERFLKINSTRRYSRIITFICSLTPSPSKMTYNALCIEDDALFRKNVLSIQKHDFKSKRINKVDNMRQNKSGKNNSVRYPELPIYNFADTPKEIVNSLRNVEANIRWLKKYDQPGKAKNRTTWCDFHDDHGHTTEDCISLRMKVVYHKPKGHL